MSKTILQEAHDLIYGDREQEYGHPIESLGNIAMMWSAYLTAKFDAEFIIGEADVCQFMVLLKMCRGFNGASRDSIIDQAGYTGLLERIKE